MLWVPNNLQPQASRAAYTQFGKDRKMRAFPESGKPSNRFLREFSGLRSDVITHGDIHEAAAALQARAKPGIDVRFRTFSPNH